ncbi:hypothetical protein P7C73_g2981, partial [Tremellales sp. Uapishka_1]
MIFPDSTSFTPLATLHLPAPHVLHPHACNPAMDLVVLLSTSLPSGARNVVGKGKEKASSGKGDTTKVALWRMSGSKVWEVELEGRVLGLAWSRDGLYLSMLVLNFPSWPSFLPPSREESKANTSTIEHLSVHTGSKVRSIPFTDALSDLSEASWSDCLDGNRWWKMEWTESGLDWGKDKNGSSGMIIDSLPRVTPVDPPVAASANPFMMINPAAASTSTTPSIHPNLASFPSILPAIPPPAPDILYLRSPGPAEAEYRLLTGTFPLAANTPLAARILALARISDRMSGFLDVILRGLEAAELAVRDGEKENIKWREELETCAEQQAMTVPEVHADLFKLLTTGRSGVAVNEWLGNRLTGRTIAKWELTMDSCCRNVQKIISESVAPAVERLVLLVEELRGWAKASTRLNLDGAKIDRILDISCGLASLVESIRQIAEHESHAATEWIKWLKYEIARTTIQDPQTEELPLAVHDLKLVWSFMINGFISSPFTPHFPNLSTKPPRDTLPPGMELYPARTIRSLDDVLEETYHLLSGETGPKEPATPLPEQSSMSLEQSSPIGDDSLEQVQEDQSDASSDRSFVAKKKEEKPSEREFAKEPWIWANSLVDECMTLVRGAGGRETGGEKDRSMDPGAKSLVDERICDDKGSWMVFVPTSADGDQRLWLLNLTETDPTPYATAFSLGCRCLAVQFFDDDEIVMILQDAVGRFAVTMEYRSESIVENLSPVPVDTLKEDWDLGVLDDMIKAAHQELPLLPIARCRPLKAAASDQDPSEKISLALNGRKGRRVGCISMGEGREVEVLDMDQDEDADDDDEDGGGEDDGDDEQDGDDDAMTED